MYKFNIRLQLMIIFIRDKSAYYFVDVKQNSVDEITSVVSSCTYLTIYVKMKFTKHKFLYNFMAKSNNRSIVNCKR